MAGASYPRPAPMAPLTAALDGADAFIMVTPEYNRSYPASLKAAIDWHYTQWAAKPVAFVSYGGVAGGRHAVQHLDNVMSELHAVTIHDGLAFPLNRVRWEDGRPSTRSPRSTRRSCSTSSPGGRTPSARPARRCRTRREHRARAVPGEVSRRPDPPRRYGRRSRPGSGSASRR